MSLRTDEIDNSSDDRKREIMKNNTFKIAQKAKSSQLDKDFAGEALEQMSNLLGDEGTTDQEGEGKEVYKDLSDIHKRFLKKSEVIDAIENRRSSNGLDDTFAQQVETHLREINESPGHHQGLVKLALDRQNGRCIKLYRQYSEKRGNYI